jgi:hypothetical protein
MGSMVRSGAFAVLTVLVGFVHSSQASPDISGGERAPSEGESRRLLRKMAEKRASVFPPVDLVVAPSMMSWYDQKCPDTFPPAEALLHGEAARRLCKYFAYFGLRNDTATGKLFVSAFGASNEDAPVVQGDGAYEDPPPNLARWNDDEPVTAAELARELAAGAPMLEQLGVEESGIRGDVQDFAPLAANLLLLNVSSTPLLGDWNLNASRLLVLDGSESCFNYNMAQLTKSKSLMLLAMTSQGLASCPQPPSTGGDISALSGLKNLTALYVSGAGFTGDLRNIAGLRNLRIIALISTTVTGDLRSLRNLPLVSLALTAQHANADVLYGDDTRDIAECFPNLRVLTVGVTTEGLFQHLTHLPLEHLWCSPCALYGSTKDLVNTTMAETLQTLHVRQSENFGGDIKHVSTLVNLIELTFNEAKVFGNISMFGLTLS